MPKHKPSKNDDTSDSDSGPDDRGPAKKVPKTESSKPKSGKSNDDSSSWELGKNRFIRLTEFKGKWFVDIREFYNADGEMKPGKRGIMLSMEQWQKFKTHVDEVDEAIKKNV